MFCDDWDRTAKVEVMRQRLAAGRDIWTGRPLTEREKREAFPDEAVKTTGKKYGSKQEQANRRKMVDRLLRETSYTQLEIARITGVSPSTVSRRAARLGIKFICGSRGGKIPQEVSDEHEPTTENRSSRGFYLSRLRRNQTWWRSDLPQVLATRETG